MTHATQGSCVVLRKNYASERKFLRKDKWKYAKQRKTTQVPENGDTQEWDRFYFLPNETQTATV